MAATVCLSIVNVKARNLFVCFWSQFKRCVSAQTDAVWSDDWWFGVCVCVVGGHEEGARKEVRGSE